MVELRKSYPEDILKRLHESMLDILDAIADVCAKNDIRWYLAAGTVLGAARHKGFIPWDDDIDIGMMRPDYERFLQVAPRDLPDRFELLTPETPGYAPLFSKVMIKGTRFQTDENLEAGLDLGIFVDIWVRDLVAADPVIRRRQVFWSDAMQYASYLYHSDKVHANFTGVSGKIVSALLPAGHFLLKTFVSDKAIRNQFDRKIALAPGTKTIGTTSFPSPGLKLLPESMFENYDQVEFEGRLYPCPSPVEEYCRLTYGKNWQQLPPMEKRVNHAPRILDFGDGVNVFEDQ